MRCSEKVPAVNGQRIGFFAMSLSRSFCCSHVRFPWWPLSP